MRIKKEELKKIREQVAEQLEKVPDGERIVLPKEILEELIFDYYVVQTRTDVYSMSPKKIAFKIIAWNMPYYYKLDLSEVSFDNVYWGNEQILQNACYISPKITTEELKYKPIINLSNTNAKINFSKAIPIVKVNPDPNKCHSVICVSNCNFSNTDLSNNNISHGYEFISTNLSNTNINISLIKDNYFRLFYCNLTNVPLNDQKATEYYFAEDGIEQKPYISYSILRNTGLNISLPSYSYINENDILKIMVTSGGLKGTYINGRRISTGNKDERFERKKNIIKHYEKYRDNFKKTINESIAAHLVKK